MTKETPQAPALFSVHPPTEDVDLLPEPTNGPYYIYHQGGWFVHRNFHWGRVLVPVAKADPLPEMKPYLWGDINLPIEVVGQAWSFFRAIYQRDHAEAMVDITWSKEKGYRLFVPLQHTSGGGVSAKRNMEHYKDQKVGTIHSHCMMSAFHSGTDHGDADDDDGLHITLGKVMNDQPEIAIMIAVSKRKWDYEPKELWQPTTIPQVSHPAWWEKQVSPMTYSSKSHGKSKTSNAPYRSNGKGLTGLVIPPAQRPYTPTAPSRYNKFYSIDEFLWRRDKMIDNDQAATLTAMNEIIDELAKAFDHMGLEFDYTLELNSTSKTTVEGQSRDDIDEYFLKMGIS